jgi:hypothetical protein
MSLRFIDLSVAGCNVPKSFSEQWCNYWLHSGHLSIDGLKMSKSLKNFITIREALKEFSARQLRLLFCLQPWNAPMTFNQQSRFEMVQKESTFKNFFLSIQVQMFSMKLLSHSQACIVAPRVLLDCMALVLVLMSGACLQVPEMMESHLAHFAQISPVPSLKPELHSTQSQMSQVALRKNPLEKSTTAQHEVHHALSAAIGACQECVHKALLDNIDTATAVEELLSAPLPYQYV